jgi:fructosamine-3-kinase
MRLKDRIEQILGKKVISTTPLGGGCVGEVYKVFFETGELVAKVDSKASANLDIEGRMLQYLKSHAEGFPVPSVYHCAPELLLMECFDAGGRLGSLEQKQAARHFALLHGISHQRGFGFSEDTLIGGLHQPNSWCDSWVQFYKEQRLLYMGEQAVRSGGLSSSIWKRLQKFSQRLGDFIPEPESSSLLHGDAWGGNVICGKHGISGYIDPAVYYGDPEVELAFTTMFHTFGDEFFREYSRYRKLPSEFFQSRRQIYLLYPNLVHARLFGSGYAGAVSSILSGVGF